MNFAVGDRHMGVMTEEKQVGNAIPATPTGCDYLSPGVSGEPSSKRLSPDHFCAGRAL